VYFILSKTTKIPLSSYRLLAATSEAPVSSAAGAAGGGLRLVNPVFLHQARYISEVPGIARNQQEAVPESRTAYHQVKIIDRAAGPAKAGFLGGVVFEAVRNGQDVPFKRNTKLV
jgi:hypothetical protein